MNRRNTIIFNILVALGAVGYITGASILWFDKQTDCRCSKIDVQIAATSPYHFVTDSSVRQWIADDSVKMMGVNIKKIEKHKIETYLKKHLYVDSIESYTTMDGTISIRVSQCVPMLRIKSDDGYDFYIDSTLKVLPIEEHCRAAVPIISGNPRFGFASNFYGSLDVKKYQHDREYLKNITNFVGCVNSDNFLRELIVQIYINRSGEIELVPRIGDQIILFGTFDDHVGKLAKLKKFYLNSFSQEWWKTARRVNLKFKDQVLVS